MNYLLNKVGEDLEQVEKERVASLRQTERKRLAEGFSNGTDRASPPSTLIDLSEKWLDANSAPCPSTLPLCHILIGSNSLPIPRLAQHRPVRPFPSDARLEFVSQQSRPGEDLRAETFRGNARQRDEMSDVRDRSCLSRSSSPSRYRAEYLLLHSRARGRQTSSRDEAFLDLSIDIEQNSSVTACLRQFSASETLCQRNKFYCDTCCGLQEAEKRFVSTSFSAPFIPRGTDETRVL